MRMRLDVVTLGALSFVPMTYANPPAQPDAPAAQRPMSIWVPGAAAPRDIDGNSAVANAPTPAAGDHGAAPSGGLRGDPNWAPFGPSGADADSIAASPTVAGLLLAGVSNAFGGGSLYRSTDSGVTWSTTTGTENRGIKEVEFAPGGTAWAATGDGLFTSTDGGQNWSMVALPVAGQALVEDVAVDPTGVIWVGLGQFLGGTSTQLVFKSADGVNWTDASPPVGSGLGATVVAVDPANTQRIYSAFTGNFGAGGELWVSTDGGVSWTERGAGLPDNMINDVAFGPGGVVYVAGGQDFGSQFLGLYSSPDDGLSWNELSFGWPSQSARAVAVNPANPLQILVGTTRGGVVATTDGGANWTFSAGGTGTYQVNDVAFVPGTPNVFLGMGSVAVFRSTNGGSTFTPSSNGMSNLELTSMAVNPLNTSEIAASYVGSNDGGIFISTDAGATWTLSQAPLPRWQKVYFAPDGTLYGTHDGPLGRADDGVWQRQTNGSWANLGPGSPVALDNIGFEIAVSSGPSPKILFGVQEWLGGWAARVWSYNRAAPNAWELEFNSDAQFDQVNSLLWLNGGAGPEAIGGIVNFGGGTSGGVIRSTDSGDTWARSENGYVTGWHAWEVAAGPGGSVYVSGSANTGSFPAGIFKSTDGGVNWTQQGNSDTFRSFAVDPVLPGTIYGSDVFSSVGPIRSTDDGVTFQPFNNGFIPGRAIRDWAYGGVVAGVRKLYIATSAGGFATDLAGGEPECPADWNDDNTVNSSDISAFLTSWLDSLTQGNLIADFNADNTVNSSDISAFLTAWLAGVQGGC